MSLIHNERVKLTAVWFNTLSAAAVAAGVIAPLRFYGVTAAPVAPALLYLGSGLWFFAGIGLIFCLSMVFTIAILGKILTSKFVISLLFN